MITDSSKSYDTVLLFLCISFGQSILLNEKCFKIQAAIEYIFDFANVTVAFFVIKGKYPAETTVLQDVLI